MNRLPRIALLAVVAASLALASGCSDGAANTEGPAPVVLPAGPEALGDGRVRLDPATSAHLDIEEVTPLAWRTWVSAPARVSLRDGALVAVSAPLNGRITSIDVVVGQQVEAGDALARIVSADAAGARAELQSAQAHERSARDQLARQQRLMEAGVGIERDLVTAEIEVASAQADVRRARLAVQALGEGSGSEIVLRAPISGTIITRAVSSGSSVTDDGEPLFEIGDLSGTWFVADVFERDLVHVDVGAEVRIERVAGQDALEGRVALIGSTFDTSMRRAPVYIELTSPNGSVLRPGTTARVDIATSAEASMVVPTSALLLKDGTRRVVYVQTEENVYEMRDVTVGRTHNGVIQVLHGLNEGDRVVTRGALLVDADADLHI